jgi:hypothetical protein
MNWSSAWEIDVIDCGANTEIPITLKLIIKDGDFPTTVEAIQVGDLAVHDHIKSDKDGYWQVTHVPTNTRFNAVPDGLHEKAALIEWCKKVQGMDLEGWKALSELTADSYSIKIEAKDRIKAMCLETKI